MVARSKAVYGRLVMLDSEAFREVDMAQDFSMGGRIRHIRRLAKIASVLSDQCPVVVAAVTPTLELRQIVKEILPGVELVYLHASAELCESRGKPLWKDSVFEQPVCQDGLMLSAEHPSEVLAARLIS